MGCAKLTERAHEFQIAVRQAAQGSDITILAPEWAVLSLEVSPAGTREPVGDTLTEDDGLAAWHGQNCCAAAAIELHHALQAALARLRAEDRRFCVALAHCPVTVLAAEGFGSRSALYRRLADLRHALTTHGLGPGLDDLAAV